ncbi:MAG: NAD(P)H:quinone oxidoreductase [Candidatus Cloacimonetes bacterium]|nr:NAD(P)H:quinone oxidoreductase [Candidatus Cloacimonadota bacterium]
MKILVLFYSTYGHIYHMAKAVVEGAKQIEGIEVELKRVPETLSPEVIEMMGATQAQTAFSEVPIASVNELADYDAIIFGSPTRFGNMTAQMKAFLDATGSLWAAGALIGKIGSVFTSSATQHGGQESTILSFHTVLLHHGMLIAGLPYSFAGQTIITEMSGGSPYGASTIAGGDGSRMPSENELQGARFQGKHVASLVARMKN